MFKHNEYATELIKNEIGEDKFYDDFDKMPYPYSILHGRGWIRIKVCSYEPFIHILGDYINLERPMRNTMSPPMNTTQMRIAKMICEEHNTTLHKAINDKRFW